MALLLARSVSMRRGGVRVQRSGLNHSAEITLAQNRVSILRQTERLLNKQQHYVALKATRGCVLPVTLLLVPVRVRGCRETLDILPLQLRAKGTNALRDLRRKMK